MKVIINMFFMVYVMILLIINPVQAGDMDKCAPDYDISRIHNVPLDEHAKYAFNETEIIVDAPLETVFHFGMNAPLENLVPGTDAIPGVRSTRSLNNIKTGEDGYVRVCCLDDGNTVIEEILQNIPNQYFAYKVWDYTLKYGHFIEYAKGEFRYTAQGDKTHIKWRYSFKLNHKTILGGTGPVGRWLFKTFFLRTRYNEFMIASLNAIKNGAEKKYRKHLDT